MKDIAEAIARGLRIPAVSLSGQDAPAHFGAVGFFATMSNPATSTLTRERLGWAPGQHPGLLQDLENASAFSR